MLLLQMSAPRSDPTLSVCLQERFTRISQRMSRALQARAQDVSYSHGLVMLSLAADGQAESRERALYQLITLSDALSALELEVRKLVVHRVCGE